MNTWIVLNSFLRINYLIDANCLVFENMTILMKKIFLNLWIMVLMLKYLWRIHYDLEYMIILNYVLHCFHLQKSSEPNIFVCFKLLKELSFYNTSIEKPCIKLLNNIDLQLELPFYNKLSIVKTSKAFKKGKLKSGIDWKWEN